MVKVGRLYQRLLNQGASTSFRDFQRVLEAFGFELDRTKGSHLIYVHPDLAPSVSRAAERQGREALPDSRVP